MQESGQMLTRHERSCTEQENGRSKSCCENWSNNISLDDGCFESILENHWDDFNWWKYPMRKTLFPLSGQCRKPTPLCCRNPMAWNYLGRKVRDIALGGTPDQQRPCPSGHLIYIILHHYLVMVITIFVHRAYHQYAQGYNFPIQTTPKKFQFPS